MSDDSDRSDLFGHAISLDGGLLLAGAPKKHRDVPEIQLVVSTGSSVEVRATVLWWQCALRAFINAQIDWTF